MDKPPTLPDALAQTQAGLPPKRALNIAKTTDGELLRYTRFTGYPTATTLGDGLAFDLMLDRGYGYDEVVSLLAGRLLLRAARGLQVQSQL